MNSSAARLSLRISAVLMAAVVAGCAGLDAGQCRDANWYEVGYRDARYKMQSRVEVYTQQCERHGVT